MPKKKVKLTKEDLENEKRNKLLQEKKKQEEEKQKQKEFEEEELKKKKELWKKNELKKSLEKLKFKRIEHKKQELHRKRRLKEESDKLLEIEVMRGERKEREEKKERRAREVPRYISIKSERIKHRKVNIELNKKILEIIVILEKIVLDNKHQHIYKSILSDTVRCVINNVKDETSMDIGPLDMLYKYVYSVPQKNPRDKVEYVESLSNFLLDQNMELIDLLLEKLF